MTAEQWWDEKKTHMTKPEEKRNPQMVAVGFNKIKSCMNFDGMSIADYNFHPGVRDRTGAASAAAAAPLRTR